MIERKIKHVNINSLNKKNKNYYINVKENEQNIRFKLVSRPLENRNHQRRARASTRHIAVPVQTSLVVYKFTKGMR
jgi:hypothetical protein